MKRKQEIVLSVPQPCSQDWDRMSANEIGRHCTNCNKTVIDFSNYTDKELAQFFKKAKGEVCGRINNYQANRPILIAEQANRSIFHKLLYGIVLISWLGIASTASAQSNNAPKETKQKNTKEIKGTKSKHFAKSDSAYIKGELVDAKSNQPLPFSNILLCVNDTQIAGRVTDIDGKFMIGPVVELPGRKLKCASEGYRDSTIALKPNENYVSIKLVMEPGKNHIDMIICTPRNKPFNTPDGSTFNRNDTPYLSPR